MWVRPERLFTIIEVMIAGGFFMGLAHTSKSSGEKALIKQAV